MSDKDNIYNEIEKRISESLSKGLSTGDFSGLNSVISDSVRGAIKEASDQVSDVLRYGYKKPHSTREESQAYMAELQAKRAERNANKTLPATSFKPIGKGSSTASVFFGAAGLILSLGAMLSSLFKIVFLSASPVGLIMSAVFMLAFCVLLKNGLTQKGDLERAKRYAQICGSNMYAQLSAIADASGIKLSKVKKDIRKMLRKGYFPQGYLDDEETTLMLSNDVYKQYQQTKKYALTQAKSENNEGDAKSKAKAKLSKEQREELDLMVNEGHAYIEKLHQLNDNIPGEVITKKLSALETTLTEIFTRVEEHPEQMDRMHKLMEYYLPTMLKLVQAYYEYDKVSSPGEEILNAKVEIENTLDTINDAFVQLLNNLFQDSVWDVTTDAQVLQTMLKQEGLSE